MAALDCVAVESALEFGPCGRRWDGEADGGEEDDEEDVDDEAVAVANRTVEERRFGIGFEVCFTLESDEDEDDK